MVGRIVRRVDFERILAGRPLVRTSHFAMHYLADEPTRVRPTKLSTDAQAASAAPVEFSAPAGWWLGVVVPKRHAKRAVTRSLLKRQMKAAVANEAPRLPEGLWVVRLRAPFDRTRFPSATSDALRHAAREELAELLARARRR